MTDAGIYHLDLCSPELAADLTPGTGSRWQLAGGAPFRPSAAVLAHLIEESVVYADDHEARQDFTRFRENLRYCEDRQHDPNSMYVTLAFPALGDESFAFASRPKPGTAGAQEGRPDLHQVLIRRANVVIALGYMQAPATNIATTEALARRALTRFEEALGSQRWDLRLQPAGRRAPVELKVHCHHDGWDRTRKRQKLLVHRDRRRHRRCLVAACWHIHQWEVERHQYSGLRQVGGMQ